MKGVKRLLLPASLVFLLIAGCSKPEDKFVGKWDGKIEMPQEALDMIKGMASTMLPADQKGKIEEFEKFVKDGRLELDLQAEGKARLTSINPDGEDMAQEATWKLAEDGKTLSVTVARSAATPGAMGSVSRDLNLSVSEDNRKLSIVQSDGGLSMTISFAKR